MRWPKELRVQNIQWRLLFVSILANLLLSHLEIFGVLVRFLGELTMVLQ